MGLFERAKMFVASKDQNNLVQDIRAVDASDFGFAPGFFGGNRTAGEDVDVEAAMRAAMGACIRLLADDISTLPWHAYRKTASGGRKQIDGPDWMETPSSDRWDTPEAHISDAVVSLLSDGNLFLEGLPNTIVPSAILVLDPTQVDVKTGPDGFPRYRTNGTDYDGASIAHVPWIRLPGQLRGLNMVEQAREFTGLELAARKWEGNFFQNGATVGGVILLPREAKKPDTETVAALRRQFDLRHKGNENSWMRGILTGGATIHDGSIKPAEAELEPLWNHVLEEAARFYHIPPHLLASQSGSSVGTNVEHRSIEYVQHAIVPVVRRLERVYSRLIPGADTYVKFNVAALLRGDSKTRADARAVELQNRVITRQEWRDSEDYGEAPVEEAGYLDTPNNRTSDPRLEDMSKLIRAGFDPVQSAAFVGITGIDHLGFQPTTQYLITDEDSDTEDSPAQDEGTQT